MANIYVRRSTQIAKTSGICLLCNDLMRTGEPMSILAYGGKSNEWGRAHPECADESPFVLNPDVARLAADAAVREQPVDEPTHSEVDFVELAKGQYEGYEKYAVRINGRVIWKTSDRRRAEGAVAFYPILKDHLAMRA